MGCGGSVEVVVGVVVGECKRECKGGLDGLNMLKTFVHTATPRILRVYCEYVHMCVIPPSPVLGSQECGCPQGGGDQGPRTDQNGYLFRE